MKNSILGRKPGFLKPALLVTLVFLSVTTTAQHSLTKLWESESTLPVPESVLFDGTDKLLYVALIDGEPNGKDGKGEIARVGLDGKIINAAWVSGLNAPKGMGRYKNFLYVADIDEVVIIDIANAKILNRIPIEGATFLNDITIDDKGTVYVSDSQTGKVHMIKAGVASTYLSSLKGPNGLLASKGKLYVLASGELLEVGSNLKTKVLATGLNSSTDGIEAVDGNDFIVSCWEGVVYFMPKKGAYQQLLDTKADKSNTADIGYDAVNKIVYVPTFFKNSVVAYQLK